MGISRNNGTHEIEIGKFYRNNGTTAIQIGKMYRSNGTTENLIYSAETEYFNGKEIVDWSTYNSNGSTASVDTTLKSYITYDYHIASLWTTEKQDITNIKTLIFTVSKCQVKNCQFFLGISENKESSLNCLQPYQFTKYVSVTSAGTYSVDVSGYTGSYYIVVAGTSGGENGNYGNTCEVSKVIGE